VTFYSPCGKPKDFPLNQHTKAILEKSKPRQFNLKSIETQPKSEKTLSNVELPPPAIDSVQNNFVNLQDDNIKHEDKTTVHAS
jgi:hypothetical protein